MIFKELVPVTARGEATRRRLLTAAATEFGARGFHATSISSITQEAGVGQGTFYLYFRSKEEVFANLVRDIAEALRRRIARAVVKDGRRDAAERRSLEAFLGFAQEFPGRYRIVQEAQFVDHEAFRDCYECLAQSYDDALAGTSAPGDSPPSADEAQTRAWSLLGIGHALGLRHCLWQGRLPEPQVLEEALRVIGSTR